MMWQGFRLNCLRAGVFVFAWMTLCCSLGLCLLLPVPASSFTGGKVKAIDGGSGVTGTWINNCGQPIHDCMIVARDSSDEAIDPTTVDVDVSVDGESKDWTVTDNFGGTDKKKMVSTSAADDCGMSGEITISTSDDVHHLDIWFTDKTGDLIYSNMPITALSAADTLTFPALDPAMNDRWSQCLMNKTGFLVTGFTFVESPDSLTMSQLKSSRLGTTSTSTKTVTFEFPMRPGIDQAVIGAKYSSQPTADTTVKCTPIVSKVTPESANARQSFSAGTGVSVPNITITEGAVGAITSAGGYYEIILTPRDQFAFASVESLTVQSGNILLGSPYISNGRIHIEILASSYGEGKSEIILSGIKVDQSAEMTEGTVSVRQTEPSGNASNFHYAYFEPAP